MRFKRSIDTVAEVVVFVLFVAGLFAIIYIIFNDYSIWKLIIAILLLIILMIFCRFAPADFDYYIQVKGDLIIIETAETDHRRFNRNSMKIVDKNRHTIILDDGIERAEICYNAEMLEFLKEIEES